MKFIWPESQKRGSERRGNIASGSSMDCSSAIEVVKGSESACGDRVPSCGAELWAHKSDHATSTSMPENTNWTSRRNFYPVHSRFSMKLAQSRLQPLGALPGPVFSGVQRSKELAKRAEHAFKHPESRSTGCGAGVFPCDR